MRGNQHVGAGIGMLGQPLRGNRLVAVIASVESDEHDERVICDEGSWLRGAGAESFPRLSSLWSSWTGMSSGCIVSKRCRRCSSAIRAKEICARMSSSPCSRYSIIRSLCRLSALCRCASSETVSHAHDNAGATLATGVVAGGVRGGSSVSSSAGGGSFELLFSASSSSSVQHSSA